MEFHNYNTPLDRVDETFVKQMLAGNFDPMNDLGNGCGECEQKNPDCNCSSRSSLSKTCRYNRHYSRNNDRRKTDVSQDRSIDYNCKKIRMESSPNDDSSCGCDMNEPVCGCGECEGFSSPELSGVPHSMVYSPYQHFDALYECEEALDRGTIFRCLDFPFYPTPCKYDKCAHENKGCR